MLLIGPFYVCKKGDQVEPFVFKVFTFIILYNNLIPISLTVTLEMVRFVQAIFISWVSYSDWLFVWEFHTSNIIVKAIFLTSLPIDKCSENVWSTALATVLGKTQLSVLETKQRFA